MATRTEKLLALLAVRSLNPGVPKEEIMSKADGLLAHRWLDSGAPPKQETDGEKWRRADVAGAQATQTKGSIESARKQVRDSLLAEAGNDPEVAKKILARRTSFVVATGKDRGKKVPGRSSVDSLTDKQVWRLLFELRDEGLLVSDEDRPQPQEKAPPPKAADPDPDDLPF